MRLLPLLILLTTLSCGSKSRTEDPPKAPPTVPVMKAMTPVMHAMPPVMHAMTKGPSSVMAPVAYPPAGKTNEKALMAQTPLLNVPLKDLVKEVDSLGGELWYGLYVMGKKMGWFTSAWEKRTVGGKLEIVNRQRIHIELINLQGRKTSTIGMEFVYQGVGKGLLVSQTITQSTPMEKGTYTLTLGTGGVYTFTSRSALASSPDKAVVKTVPITDNPGTLSDSELALFYTISRGNLGKSPVFKTRRFIHTHQLVAQEVLKILSSEKVPVSGVASTVYKALIFTSVPRSRFNAMLDSSGKILEGQIGMFTIKREEKKTAQDIRAVDDLGFMAMIPSTIKGLTMETPSLTLRMKGSYPKDIQYFNTSRYHVSFGAKDTFTLKLKRDSLKGLTLGTIPRDILPFTKPGPGVESDHAVIKEMAAKAVKKENNPLNRVKLLTAFVARTIEDKMFYDFDSAVNVARFKKGDCTEHSLLFTALARSLGIPARRVGGVGLVKLGTRHLFGYHMWVQVWLGRWIDVDPTWNQVPADVSHIMMGDVMDSQWIQSIGTLKIHSHTLGK